MPELPEVETVMQAIRPLLLGRRIEAVIQFVARLRRPLTLDQEPELLGREILDVRRRAKYILVEFAGSRALLLHLGMTGSMRIEPEASPKHRHDRVEFRLDNGRVWRFSDPRRFGQVEFHPLPKPGGLPHCLPTLAPEPLSPEFDLAWFRTACRGRSRPIKNLLMDNALVVGVGNIYASEALFRAGIRPDAAAGKLRRPRLVRLHAAIQDVLREAIAAGGTTIRNFSSVDGTEGAFRRELNVYGRQGKRCRRCGRGWIRRRVMAGRSTFFCPVCQR